MAAVAERLTYTLPDVVTERARRAPVDIDADSLPRLVVTGGDVVADQTMEPGRTHYTITLAVAGFVAASTDLAAEQALSTLYARVVDVLDAWTPGSADAEQPLWAGRIGAQMTVARAQASGAQATAQAAAALSLGLGDLAEQGAEFRLYDAEESARPAGEFVVRFSLLAVSPAGGAWSS